MLLFDATKHHFNWICLTEPEETRVKTLKVSLISGNLEKKSK